MFFPLRFFINLVDESPLPTLEIGANFLIWIGAIAYSYIKLYESCLDMPKSYFHYDFKPGWKFLNRKRDVTDTEWDYITYYMFLSIPWIFVQITSREILKTTRYSSYNKHLRITISIFFLFMNFDKFVIFTIFLTSIIFAALGIYKRVSYVWIGSLIFLTFFTFLKNFDFKSMEVHTLFWGLLRLTGYHADLIKSGKKMVLLEYFDYLLYLPVLFFGPYIPYEDFENVLNFPLKNRLMQLIKNLMRILFWSFIYELALHYFYISALSYQPDFVEKFNPWALYGYGLALGQYFHVKYVVDYGFSTSFAQFDGISVPPKPKCICRIHSYSDMWRTFDVGLYKFLVNHIYKSTLKYNSIYNKLFSSFLCFTFIYLWHGVYNFVLYWAILNFIVVTIEKFGSYIFKSYSNIFPKSEMALQRLQAIISAPLFAFAIVTNFIFLGNEKLGLIFFKSFIKNSIISNVVLYFVLYTGVNVSIEVKRWEQKNVNTKKKLKL